MTDNHTTSDHASGEEAWDEFYTQNEQVWSGNPNTALVREVTDLEPGSALDLGSGEGGDAIWLAQRGWRVTATDISRVALDRAAQHAAAAEVAERIDWQRHDLGSSFPAGTFDLVSAQFLHSRDGELPREQILRSAASAVAPGGVLLIEGHASFPSWEHDHPHDVHFPTPKEVLDALELPDGQWEVQRCEGHERSQTSPDGQPTTRQDNTLKVRRLTGRTRLNPRH